MILQCYIIVQDKTLISCCKIALIYKTSIFHYYIILLQSNIYPGMPILINKRWFIEKYNTNVLQWWLFECVLKTV